jgi:chemotaxis protein MotB
VDAEGGMMFSLGSAEPTERAREIIKLVSENIRGSANRIAIEGHTDAAPFKNAQTTNWELSTARASAARRELEKNGIDSSKMARVVGYADQELLIPDNPTDARNRRISIILLHEKSSSKNP